MSEGAQPGSRRERLRLPRSVEGLWDDHTEVSIADSAGLTRDSLRRRRENPDLWCLAVLDLARAYPVVRQALGTYLDGIEEGRPEGSPVRAVGGVRQLLASMGLAIHHAATAMADGRLSQAEAQQLVPLVVELLNQGQQVLADLTALGGES